MKFVVFTHSLVSDWNHGNAHFLRGVLGELIARGHQTVAYEPADGWSRSNLIEDQGLEPIDRFHARFPRLKAATYDKNIDLSQVLDGADVVIVHEWTAPWLIAAIGHRRAAGGAFTLLFHDTHHRAVSAEGDIEALELDGFDGILAFGEVLSERYRRRGWGHRVFTWHEAADTRTFFPRPHAEPSADLVWIGNWGDGERARELEAYLIEPASRLGLRGNVYGVRYPQTALNRLHQAGLSYRGWLANADVPDAFARHRATVHVPRGPYVDQLPGIPTIRVFEALACGIPLITAPWEDVEGLFRPGEDFLVARRPEEMAERLQQVLADPQLAAALRDSGLETITTRHTCAHRVDELFAILEQIGAAPTSQTNTEVAA